ncbi:hypothetical protein N0V83_008447 [Neocucurbitaria cava]|uniref:Protein kinase domain-containing protein n=1 Tax=Neocucurbitaria cava TaxID=798079 RepID=A0A9W9CJJ9_9PLEO|nr:hypothetical protein N0V83_008447 [Neocucurbitaria cava]
MSLFRKANFTDAKLPLDWSAEEVNTDIEKHDFRMMERRWKRKAGSIWGPSLINDFHVAQWKFHAPVISAAVEHHDFGRRTLPFIHKNTALSKGAYGIVYKYEIHRAHFKDPLSMAESPSYVFAVKELNKIDGKVARHWGAEVRALARMNKLKQKHIVRFITAYRRGKPDDLEHYVMFEWADGGNLSTLWERDRQPELSVARVKWVIEQLRGLAQALSAAHYLREDDGQYHGGSYRHGDLKPANILWFREGDEFGTLKIGDWGEAKEHDAVTSLRHSTTAQFATRRYEPPEVVTGLQLTLSDEAKDVRSRLYDIWSIGCITLEFIIWILYGEDGRKKFDKNNRGHYGVSDMFYEVNSEGIASVHGAVKYWIDQMANDPRCRPQKTALGDLLEVVRDGLLVVKVPRDGGPIRSYVPTPQVFSNPDLNLSGKVSTITTTYGQTILQTDAPSDVPSIKIDQAGPMISLPTPEHNSQAAERFPATELAEQLSRIINANPAESYWCNGSPARPAPVYPTKSFSSSLSIPRKSNSEGPMIPVLDKVDYGNPKLDPDDWNFILDNTFAANLLSNLLGSSIVPPHPSIPDSICSRCQEFHDKMWSPIVRVSYDTQQLMHSALGQTCNLCCLLWQTCKEYSRTTFSTVEFLRSDSTLTLRGVRQPVLTLFRRNKFKGRASDIQIGLTELPNAGDDLHLGVLRGWLDDCDNDGDNIIRLKETKNQDCGDWVALSYRWGPLPHFSTTQQNLKEHIAGMEWAKLPLTFKDAIRVTRALGRQYLWIDSICIIQGEDGDFSEESKRMEDVYSGAYCVLAASCATGQKSGFLLPRPKKRKYVALGSPNEDDDDGIYVCERIENFKDHVSKGALSQRGWVLQEHALARRTIFFTEHQTYWECGDGVRCETMAKMTNDYAALLGDPEFPKILNPAKHGEKITRFQELYQQYSRLDLSKDYDRPTAINGLQQRLLRTMGVRGGYGMFDDCENKGLLRRSLLWHRGSDTESLKAIVFPPDRETVPSWSWMGVSGGIDYFPLAFFRFDWQDIVSPWAEADSAKASVGIALSAEAHEFDKLEDELSEQEIIFDNPADCEQYETMAVVLGIEKGQRALEDKKHYILLVTPRDPSDSLRPTVCKRIGAGYLPGKCFTGESRICSLV